MKFSFKPDLDSSSGVFKAREIIERAIPGSQLDVGERTITIPAGTTIEQARKAIDQAPGIISIGLIPSSN